MPVHTGNTRGASPRQPGDSPDKMCLSAKRAAHWGINDKIKKSWVDSKIIHEIRDYWVVSIMNYDRGKPHRLDDHNAENDRNHKYVKRLLNVT